MSIEAITMIREAEEAAVKSRAQAMADAKTAEADAVTAGKASVEAAAKKARQEVEEKLLEFEAAANGAAEALTAETENVKAALKSKAEGKLDAAAALIVERIVSG